MPSVIVGAVVGHAIDEEEAQHLDALRSQPELLVEVLVDGLADLQALVLVLVDLADGLAEPHDRLGAGEADVLLALGAVDVLDDVAVVDVPAAGELHQVDARLDLLLLPLDLARPDGVVLDVGGDALLVVDADQPDVGLVVAVGDRDARHLDLLDELALVGVHRVQPVDLVVLVPVRRRVAEGAQRIQRSEGLGALLGRVDALRLVDDDDGVGRLNELDGLGARHAVVRSVDDVGLRLLAGVGEAAPEGVDVDDHDLDAVAGGEVPDLAELLGVVDEVVEADVVVEPLEVLLGHLERLVDALLDGDGGHDDDELGEAVPAIQLEDAAQVDVGLAGARLHLDGEVEIAQLCRGLEAIAQLDLADVREDVLVEQLEAVADAEVVLARVPSCICGVRPVAPTVKLVWQVSWPSNRSTMDETASAWKSRSGLNLIFILDLPHSDFTSSMPACFEGSERRWS